MRMHFHKTLGLSVLLHLAVLFGVAGPQMTSWTTSEASAPTPASRTLNLVLVAPKAPGVSNPKPHDNAATQEAAKPLLASKSSPIKSKTAFPEKNQLVSDKAPRTFPEKTNHQSPENTPVANQASQASSNQTVSTVSTTSASNTPSKAVKQIVLGTTKLPLNYEFYTDAWRTKVENIGQRMYPSSAAAATPNPVLTLSVLLHADGHLGAVRVVRSSGNADLDQAAIRIVEAAAPYAAFPADIRAEVEQIEIIRTWRFVG